MLTTKLWLLVKYIILGTGQGLTEPLPVSSSGHMIILRHLFDVEMSGLSFEIFVNMASLCAVLIIYREDLIRLIKNVTRYFIMKDNKLKNDANYVILLMIATTPTAIIGFLMENFINDLLGSIKTVGISLLITAYALWIIRNLNGVKNDDNITIKDAFVVGLAQSVALIPGISRSGATLVAAMLLGMKKETALRFSFLLYIPVSLGISIFSIDDIINNQPAHLTSLPNIIAFITAFFASYFALSWFIGIMKKGKLIHFSIYCAIIGSLVIIFL